MLKISEKWGLTIEDFRQRMKQAEHSREYERWLALIWVSEGKSKEEVAQLLNRHYNTVLNWINAFNEEGPEALVYQPPKGQRSWLTEEQQAQLRKAIQQSPAESGLTGVQWTYHQVRDYCQQYFGLTIKQGTASKYIRELGFVRKRPKQRYAKASEEKNASF